MRFFFFGTLRDREILELVLDRALPDTAFVPASLPDHRLERMDLETFPILVAAHGFSVPGTTVDGLMARDVERIRFFESVEYEPQTREVLRGGGARVEALVFGATARARVSGEPWTYEDWQERYKAKDLREARLWMAFAEHITVDEADRLWTKAIAEGRAIEDLLEEISKGSAGKTQSAT